MSFGRGDSVPFEPEQVAMYGIGNFGYALLNHLDANGGGRLTLRVYDRDGELRSHMRKARAHPYFHAGRSISEGVVVADDPESLVHGASVVILAVSSDATREVIERLRPVLERDAVIVNTAKALDFVTGRRLSEVVGEALGGKPHIYALLAGGMMARDLFEQQPLGVDLACEDCEVLERLVGLFASPSLHVYPCDDLTGIEFAAAFKNVIAILAGIVHGLGFSFGAETHIVSVTAQLVGEAVVHHLGGQPETFSMGRQCWGNDLWMSCTGPTRNREFGVLLGQGLSVDEATRKMRAARKTVEGLNTVRVLDRIEAVRRIVPIELLHELIVRRSITIDSIRRYLLSRAFTDDASTAAARYELDVA